LNRFKGISKTYTQAPWRKQSQVIGLILVAVIFVTFFAAVYLHISALSAEVGRQIQVTLNDIDDLDREIEDMKSQLAFIDSSDEMEKRASIMGFKPVQGDEIVYLTVPGYVARPALVFEPSQQQPMLEAPMMHPEYTESLFVWLQKQIALQLEVR
jgi:hypothetical protein